MAESHIEKDDFLIQHPTFIYLETVVYPNGGTSAFYGNGNTIVIIDHGICEPPKTGECFSYMLITDKQNQYMHLYDRVFRFLDYKQDEVDRFLYGDLVERDLPFTINVGDRSEQANASPLEIHFEDNFAGVYGAPALQYLTREYGICDADGNNYFLDYLVNTSSGKLAVEENGVEYHHPQIIGEKRYRIQLLKQNTCALWGIKLYRFSSEDCKFEDRISDDIKTYFGKDTSGFINNGIKIERKTKLYEHQEVTLDAIKESRAEGTKAFLIVLPTAAGKSRIVEEDIQSFAGGNPGFRGLVLVPGNAIKNDWEVRISTSLAPYKDQIMLCTYSYMCKHFLEYAKNQFNYIVVDEAHHVVAPMLKRVVQYFDADFMVGLTATDQRPDKKKLEEVFGNYNTSLSLIDAMNRGVVAMANVYRIETNIDLSQIRFNGKDYVNADLESKIRVTSRNDLIVDVLKEYFCSGEAAKRQGVVFCVNVNHAKEMAKLLEKSGIPSASFTGKDPNNERIMEDFKQGKIRFLCACNMLSEGWDYPELGILVMARPTLSKVLYLQQIGRGLRKTDTKKNVIVIDVVDEYGAMVRPCSMHSIFANPYYVPFGDITRRDYSAGDMIVIDGITERIEKIVEVDINTFESKYGDYYSQEQLAREYFVSTGTITSWIRNGKIAPSVVYEFGNKKVYLFSPEDVDKYRDKLGIRVHDDSTIRRDFFDFLEERDYSLSYKMPFLLAFVRHKDSIGDARIEDVLDDYIQFYQDRVDRGLQVDRATCPYNRETLADRKLIRQNMLTNPFEKFERKRFLHYSKDLKVISMNHALFSQLTDDDWKRITDQMQEDLKNYYEGLGGL